jgi:transposase InsO family protein
VHRASVEEREIGENYLFERATITALRDGLAKWFGRYNDWRHHQAIGNITPAEGVLIRRP